jgi:hypothetical protein
VASIGFSFCGLNCLFPSVASIVFFFRGLNCFFLPWPQLVFSSVASIGFFFRGPSFTLCQRTGTQR